MIESEWLTCEWPDNMVDHLKAWVATERKLRLLGIACCRRIWHHFHDSRSRAAVEYAEQYVEELLPQRTKLLAVSALAEEAFDESGQNQPEWDVGRPHVEWMCWSHAACAAWCLVAPFPGAGVLVHAARAAGWATFLDMPTFVDYTAEYTHELAAAERQQQIALIREIFGNPFRPVVVNSSWLTSDVRTLSEGIYSNRAFDRMPILADALQDAGCDNEDILSHCRQPGEHVRGCWVVDLLLGKS